LQALRWTHEHFFQTIEFMRTRVRASQMPAAPSGGGGGGSDGNERLFLLNFFQSNTMRVSVKNHQFYNCSSV
jgi:hypothetical protein